MKIAGRVFMVLAILLVLLAGSVYALSEQRMRTHYTVNPISVLVPTDQDAIIEGERLYVSRGCGDCHGEHLGGKVIIDNPAAGVIAGTNLTTGQGGLANWQDVDFVRAIRHGVRKDEKPLLFMPSQEFQHLNDADLGKMIAYIKSAKPVDSLPPKTTPGPLMRLLFLLGKVPLISAELIQHNGPRPAPVAIGPTREYGAYLVEGCKGCHGQELVGGQIPGTPPDFPKAANITMDLNNGLGKWQEKDFVVSMREGRRPDGTAINPVMPWKNFSRMNDVELKALWAYLSAQRPRQ